MRVTRTPALPASRLCDFRLTPPPLPQHTHNTHTFIPSSLPSYIVYERQRPPSSTEEGGTTTAAADADEAFASAASPSGNGKSSSGGGGGGGGGTVSLLYPKKTSLAARVRCPEDPLFLDFVSRLLGLHPDKRPTAEEALAHPWLIPPPTGPPPVFVHQLPQPPPPRQQQQQAEEED